MRLTMLLLLVSTSLAASSAASAVGAMDQGGCPAGYVAFDRQTGDGGPPAYRQGETVVASGVITNLDAGVTEVTLRWGTADGPELGRAVVDAGGAWQGLTFAVPAAVADGEQQVFYVARDRTGQMLPGLPYPFTIRVGEPVAPVAREEAPVAPSPEGARPDDGAARPERRTETTPAPAVAETVREPRQAPARPEQTQIVERPRAATPAATSTKRPATKERASAPAARRSRDTRPSPAVRRSVDRPDTGIPLTGSVRPAARDADMSRRPPSSTLPVASTPDWVLPAIGMALLFGLGAYGAGVLACRRRPHAGDDPAAATLPLDMPNVDCPVESELQSMLAENSPDPAQREQQDPVAVG